jgi:hypothetical protein
MDLRSALPVGQQTDYTEEETDDEEDEEDEEEEGQGGGKGVGHLLVDKAVQDREQNSPSKKHQSPAAASAALASPVPGQASSAVLSGSGGTNRKDRKGGKGKGKVSGQGGLQPGNPGDFTADGSNAPAHSWFVADAGIFNVRCGPDYKRNKKKKASGGAVMELVDMKMYRCSKKMKHVCSELPFPDASSTAPAPSPSSSSGVFYFVLNVQVPDYAPAMWGGAEDGEGWSVIMYFSMSGAQHAEMMSNPQEGWAVLLRRLIEAPVDDGDGKDKDAKAIHDRVKLIAKIMNVGEIDLDSFTRGLVDSHNAQPVLSRPQHRFYKGHNYFEVDVDVHVFPFLALKGLHSLLDRVKDMVIDVCVCLEGHSDDELPERALGCVRISKMDLRSALPVGQQTDYTEEETDDEEDEEDGEGQWKGIEQRAAQKVSAQLNVGRRSSDSDEEETEDILSPLASESTAVLNAYRRKLRQLQDFDEDDIDALLEHAKRRSANIQELRENMEMEYILRLRKQLKAEAQNLDEEYMRILQNQKDDSADGSEAVVYVTSPSEASTVAIAGSGGKGSPNQKFDLQHNDNDNDSDVDEEDEDEDDSVFTSVRKLSMMVMSATGFE